jgi:hypothetical protein
VQSQASLGSAPPSRPASVPKVLTIAVLAALLGGALAAVGASFMGAESIVAVLLGLLVVSPVVVRAATGRFDLFEPVVIIVGVYLVYFVVAPLVRFAMDDLWFLGYDFERDYLGGLLGVMLAVASMWLGYSLPVGPSPAPADQPAPAEAVEAAPTVRRLAWGLVLGAFAGMALWSKVGGRSLATFFLPGVLGSTEGGNEGTNVAYFFLTIEWFIPALLLLLATGGLRGRVRAAAALALVTVVYVSIGFRYRIVVLWLAVGLFAYLRVGRRPKIAQLAVPFSIVFLFSGWLAQVRLFFRSGGALGDLGFRTGDTLLAGLSDTRIFETFIALTRYVPRFAGFAGLDPLLYVFILPLPRALWPDKPQPEWADIIRNATGSAEAATAGAAVPHFGEYYIAFGWPGVILGMLAFGAAAKWLWRWFQAAPRDPWRQVIFALNSALIFQVIIRGYLAQIVQEWCFIVLPAIAITSFARRRARTRLRRRAAAAAIQGRTVGA